MMMMMTMMRKRMIATMTMTGDCIDCIRRGSAKFFRGWHRVILQCASRPGNPVCMIFNGNSSTSSLVFIAADILVGYWI